MKKNLEKIHSFSKKHKSAGASHDAFFGGFLKYKPGNGSYVPIIRIFAKNL